MDLNLQKNLTGLQGESLAMVSAASGSTSNLELVISKESLPNAIRKISVVVEETEQNNASQISGVEIGEENLDSPLRRRLYMVKSTGDILVYDTPQFKQTEWSSEHKSKVTVSHDSNAVKNEIHEKLCLKKDESEPEDD